MGVHVCDTLLFSGTPAFFSELFPQFSSSTPPPSLLPSFPLLLWLALAECFCQILSAETEAAPLDWLWGLWDTPVVRGGPPIDIRDTQSSDWTVCLSLREPVTFTKRTVKLRSSGRLCGSTRVFFSHEVTSLFRRTRTIPHFSELCQRCEASVFDFCMW